MPGFFQSLFQRRATPSTPAKPIKNQPVLDFRSPEFKSIVRQVTAEPRRGRGPTTRPELPTLPTSEELGYQFITPAMREPPAPSPEPPNQMRPPRAPYEVRGQPLTPELEALPTTQELGIDVPVRGTTDLSRFINEASQMRAEGNLEGIENSARINRYRQLQVQVDYLNNNNLVNLPPGYGITGRSALNEEVFLAVDREGNTRQLPVMRPGDQGWLANATEHYTNMAIAKIEDAMDRWGDYSPAVRLLQNTVGLAENSLAFLWSGYIKHLSPAVFDIIFSRQNIEGITSPTLEPELEALPTSEELGYQFETTERAEPPLEALKHIEAYAYDYAHFTRALNNFWPAQQDVIEQIFSNDVPAVIPPMSPQLVGHYVAAISQNNLEDAYNFLVGPAMNMSPEEAHSWIDTAVEARDGPQVAEQNLQGLVDRANVLLTRQPNTESQFENLQMEWDRLMQEGPAAVAALRESYDPVFHSRGAGGWTWSYLLDDGGDRLDSDNQNIWNFVLQNGYFPQPYQMRQITAINADRGIEMAMETVTDPLLYVPATWFHKFARVTGLSWIARQAKTGVRMALEAAERAPVIGKAITGIRAYMTGMAIRSAAYISTRTRGGQILAALGRSAEGSEEWLNVIKKLYSGTLTEAERMRYGLTRGMIERAVGNEGLLAALTRGETAFTVDDLLRMARQTTEDVAKEREQYLLSSYARQGIEITDDLIRQISMDSARFANNPRNLTSRLTQLLEQQFLENYRLAGLGRQYLDEGIIAWVYRHTNAGASIKKLERVLGDLGLTEVNAGRLFRDFVDNVPELYARYGIPTPMIGAIEGALTRPQIHWVVRTMVTLNDWYRAGMRFWTTSVLTARPSFVVYNAMDTMFRAVLHGADPFMSLDDVFRRIEELRTFFPEDVRMNLVETLIGNETLESLAASGKLPNNLFDWFRMGAERGFRTGKVPLVSGFTGGMSGMWQGVEITWRARLYIKFYDQDIRIMTTLLTGALDRMLAEAGADPTVIAALRQLPVQVRGAVPYATADPSKMIEVLETLLGIRTRGRVPVLMTSEMYAKLSTILGSETSARKFASVLQEAVREVIQRGGTEEEIMAGLRTIIADSIEGFERTAESIDLRALRNLPGADEIPDMTRVDDAAAMVDDAMARDILPEMEGPPPAPTAPAHPDPMQNVAQEPAAAPEAVVVADDVARQFEADIVAMEQQGMGDAVAEMQAPQTSSVLQEARVRGQEAAEATYRLQRRRQALHASMQAESIPAAFYLGDLDISLGRFSRAGAHREWLLDFPRQTRYGQSRAAMWRRFGVVEADEYRAQTLLMERFASMSDKELRAAATTGNLFTPREFLENAGYVLEFDEAGRLTRVAHPHSGLFDSAYGNWDSEIDRFLHSIDCPVGRNDDVFSWMDTPITIETNPVTGQVIGEAEAQEVAEQAARASVTRATEPLEVPPAAEIPTDPIERARYYEPTAQEQGLHAVYNDGSPGMANEVEGRWATMQVGDTGNREVTWLTDEQFESGRRAAIQDELNRGHTVAGYDPANPNVIPENYKFAFVPEDSATWNPMGTPPPQLPVSLEEETVQIRLENTRRRIWREMMGVDDAGSRVGQSFTFSSGYSPYFLYGRAKLPDGRMALESFENLSEYLQMSIQRAIDAGNWDQVAKLRGRLAEVLDLWEPRFATEAAAAGIPAIDPNVVRFRYPSREMMDPTVVAYLRASDSREGLLTQLRAWGDDFVDNAGTQMREGNALFSALTDEQRATLDDIGRRYIDMMAEGENVVMNGGEFLGKNFRGAVNETNRIALNYRQFSPFDRSMKQVVPFWMFPSRSIPFWMETMLYQPELVGWYLRYMSNTSMIAWQHGFVNSRGEPLPSMRGLIPIGNGMWWNPMGPLSFRYVFPNVNYWDLQEMTEGDATFGQVAVGIAFKTLSMFGASPAPWVPYFFRATGALNTDIYQIQGILPQASLIPPFANSYLKRMARQTTFGRMAMDLLDPDMSYIDFLVNRQILVDGLEQISDPNMTDAERWALIKQIQDSLDMYARGQNSDAQVIWDNAYNHIQTNDWFTSTLGYFTGLYPRMHTDADANFIRTRNEINMLRRAINTEMGARIFDLDRDIEQSWSWLVNHTYEVPENYLSTLYTSFSWVRVPSGSEPYDPSKESPEDYFQRVNRVSSSYENVNGLSYNVIVAMNIESQRQRTEYNAERDRIRATRDEALQALPVGTAWDIRSVIYRRYGEEIANLETRYPLAPRDWVIGYKPEQLVYEDFRNLWWYTVMDTAPQWDPEKYDSYDNFQADYDAWVADLPRMAIPMMRDIQTKFAEAHFFDPSMNRPEELCMRLVAETNQAGLEQWQIGNDDIYAALNYVWVNNYQSPYYTEMAKATTTEGRELLERNFLRQFGPNGQPTEQQMVQWIQARYGDRFSQDEILEALYGRGIMSMEGRQQQNASLRVGEASAATDDRIWEMLNRIPPGVAYDTFMDAFRRNGGNESWIDTFKATDSTNYWRSEDDVQQFESLLTRTLNQLGYNQRLSDAELRNRDQARNENTDFRRAVEGRLGQDFWTTLTWYMSLSSAEKAGAREEDPTISEQIDLYYDMKENWGATHPVWAQYYLGEITKKVTGGGGGGGGGTRAATVPSQGFYLPLGYRGVAEGRELLKSGKKLGSGGTGGKLPWPKGFKAAAGETLIDEIESGEPLSKAAKKLLTTLAQNQNYTPIVNQIMQIDATKSGVQEF